MTSLPTIWSCIKNIVPRNQWVDIQYIYNTVQHHIDLDPEDYDGQSPTSDIPKWLRNVRNVLQYRKKTGEIEWNGHGKYRLR